MNQNACLNCRTVSKNQSSLKLLVCKQNDSLHIHTLQDKPLSLSNMARSTAPCIWNLFIW